MLLEASKARKGRHFQLPGGHVDAHEVQVHGEKEACRSDDLFLCASLEKADVCVRECTWAHSTTDPSTLFLCGATKAAFFGSQLCETMSSETPGSACLDNFGVQPSFLFLRLVASATYWPSSIKLKSSCSYFFAYTIAVLGNEVYQHVDWPCAHAFTISRK
jgi:hypothetical protein